MVRVICPRTIHWLCFVCSYNEAMKKQKVLDKLERAWVEFNESCAGLTDDELLQSGVTEQWSVKEMMAHVSWWEEEALKHLPLILQGKRLTRYSIEYGGIDAFNAQMTELKRDLPLVEVRTGMDATHKRLVEYLLSVPEEHFASGTRFYHRLRLDTYGHYPIHTRAILTWRKRAE